MLCHAQRQGTTQLRLVRLALNEDHEITCDRERHFMAAVSLHQCQRKIYTRGNTGGSKQLAVLDENGICFHRDIRKPAAELLQIAPMCGGAMTVEQACM